MDLECQYCHRELSAAPGEPFHCPSCGYTPITADASSPIPITVWEDGFAKELAKQVAAAEARGRREGQQWAIDALRDDDAYKVWRYAKEPNRVPRLMSVERGLAADYLEALARSLDSEQTGGTNG